MNEVKVGRLPRGQAGGIFENRSSCLGEVDTGGNTPSGITFRLVNEEHWKGCEAKAFDGKLSGFSRIFRGVIVS